MLSLIKGWSRDQQKVKVSLSAGQGREPYICQASKGLVGPLQVEFGRAGSRSNNGIYFPVTGDLRHYILIGSFGIWKCFLLFGQCWPTSQKCRRGLQRASWRTTALWGSGHSVDAFACSGLGFHSLDCVCLELNLEGELRHLEGFPRGWERGPVPQMSGASGYLQASIVSFSMFS